MSPHVTYLGSARLHEPEEHVSGEFVSIGAERFYRIARYDRMEPFFMSVVSASDHWMFVSSLGGLSAGRRNADHALFPYYAEDRIHDDSDHTGSRTVLRVVDGDRRILWEPFDSRCSTAYQRSRNLYKNVFGNALLFEEVNHDLDLTFRYSWRMSDRFGFVKRAEILNTGDTDRSVEVLDGIENILPWGIQESFQSRFSVLGDAYKQNELDAATGVATFALSSLPGDSAEPAEALRATVCWSTAPRGAIRLLSSLQLNAFRGGHDVRSETRICGRRGSFFIGDRVDLAAGESRDWLIVADVGYGRPQIASLEALLAESEGVPGAVLEDVADSTRRLVAIVAGADGLQRTGDRLGSAHHFANVLFNVMRGGIFESGYSVGLDDLKAFVRAFNRETWRKHESFLEGLDERMAVDELRAAVESRGDPALMRLVTEYLPLSFSRRHGDPSRPWNRFSINVRDARGCRLLAYEGNWRDIFQNWEALCLSFPEYLPGVMAKFLNTTTADGYNPYRITKDGYEWEEPNPDEPWANLGYWGDHQLIYLLKFLEWSRAHHPGELEELLRDSRFVYAEVPYDIKSYEDLLADPRASIEYSTRREARIEARVEAVGFDGRYLADPSGRIRRANLTEKLLVPLLAKLGNFVPGGGFWMNTQRPEWNDANNALAGLGASMVTLCYARRYVAFCLELFDALGSGPVEFHEEVATWLQRTRAVLEEHRGSLGCDGIGDRERKAMLDGLGHAAGAYRAGLYEDGLSGHLRTVEADALKGLLTLTLEYLDHSIASNRRPDGLYHAYNVLAISQDDVAVERLDLMLEGQVAVLSSGALASAEALSVMEALRRSALYREDQHAYLLYPNRELPGFQEKNTIPAALSETSELLAALVADGNTDLVEADVDGALHFNGAFRNIRDAQAALASLRARGYEELVVRDSERVSEIFESVFEHRRFTGRSGTFYGYEGLGCIYWHMVSKLLLAVQEVATRAACRGEEVSAELAARYYDVRDGLGFNKAPDQFGAFPLDPYSHTPGFGGAKQPGMTGQVKEEVITRLGELGLFVEDGHIHFRPVLLREGEFLDEPEAFGYFDTLGREQTLHLEPGTLAFTYGQVPVVYRMSREPGIALHFADGTSHRSACLTLDRSTSSELFRRTGRITRVEVALMPALER